MSVTIPIYDESIALLPVSGSTPFGYYDNDISFQIDAPKFVKYAARKLGYPIQNVELQDINFYAALEEAVTTYAKELYEYKIRENYISIEGNPTGSSLNNAIIIPSLGTFIRIAQSYGAEAGVGGNVKHYSGSINMLAGQQFYDLTSWASASASLAPGDSIEVKKVFYQASPAIIRYFDPYAGTGTGFQSLMEAFGFGQFSPGINFMLMPIYFDVLKIQAIEFNDQIRKSAFSFNVVGNQLRIFPVPTYDRPLWIEYIKVSERDSVIYNPSGSNGLVSNVSNVPYTQIVYSQINYPAKQWIMLYAVASAKEILGNVRNKYNAIPYVNNEQVTLNGQQLVTDAIKERDDLVEKLREMLDEASRQKQLQRRADEAEMLNNTLSKIPMLIYVG